MIYFNIFFFAGVRFLPGQISMSDFF